jgi:molybdenum cofactor cytidylyltransferase
VRLVSIVLAAGHARRFGGNKLAADFAGEPLLSHALRTACAAPVERVILVCRAVPAMPLDARIEVVEIASDALSVSLSAGIAKARGADAAFVFLGDMPLIPPGIAAQLAAQIGDSYAAQPRFNGKPGHPVLLSARAFPDVIALNGDAGAGKLLRARSDVVHVDTDDEGVLLDVDSAEDLARLYTRSAIGD